jgi:hypothetical protein
LDIEPSPLSNGFRVAAIHDARHTNRRRVNVHLHVGEPEGDALVLDDGATELFAFLRVVERVLVRRARNAEGRGAMSGQDR